RAPRPHPLRAGYLKWSSGGGVDLRNPIAWLQPRMRLTCSLTLARGGPPTYRMMSFGTHDQVVDDGFDERNLPGGLVSAR
ncbi:unnamed protein product, partial [Musa acuminata subsp. burmannicoides]